MKRITAFLLALIMVLGLNTIALANDDIKIKVNGEYLTDAQAILVDGTTLLPVRSVGTAVGGTVDWNNDTRTASLTKGDKVVTIAIGQKEISVNGAKQAISVPAQIINGRTYVPLRALGEALNCYIEWIGDTKTVDILELANDPSEYRAWYEVDHKGRLFIKTNIGSKDWDGYSMRTYQLFKRTGYDHGGESGTGDIVICSSSASNTWDDIGEVVDKTWIYVFKGEFTHKEVWKNLGEKTTVSNSSLENEAKAMGDKFVTKFEIDTDIIIEKLYEEIVLTDLLLEYNKNNNTETYIASITGNIKESGSYGLACKYSSNPKGGMKASSISQSDGVLTCTKTAGYFSKNGQKESGNFYITYGTHYVRPDGTIVCAKTESNSIPYTFK